MLIVLNNPAEFNLLEYPEYQRAKRKGKLEDLNAKIKGDGQLPHSAYVYLPYAISFNITIYWKDQEPMTFVMPIAEEDIFIYCDETRHCSYILYNIEE